MADPLARTLPHQFGAEPPQHSFYTASDGQRLHYRHWKPAGTPNGYVVALHGIQSHSGWYEYSSGRMRAAGFEVRFLDRRGSGENAQDRGHAVHPDRLIHDVTQVLADACWERDQKTPDAPVTLLGVSWGAKLAAVVAARRPELVDGLALLYPGLRSRFGPRFYQRWLLNLGILLGEGRKLVRIPLDDPALFTGVPDWEDFIRQDPLALHQATLSFLKSSLLLDEELDRAAGAVSQPTLVMLAGRDQIIDNPATREFLNHWGPGPLEVREYPNARHTLEFEPDREAVFSDLIAWLTTISRRA